MQKIKLPFKKHIPPLNSEYRDYKFSESLVVFDKNREILMNEEYVLTLKFYANENDIYCCAWFGSMFGYLQTSATMKLPEDEEVYATALVSEKIFNQVFETETGNGITFNDVMPQLFRLEILDFLKYITGTKSLDAVLLFP